MSDSFDCRLNPEQQKSSLGDKSTTSSLGVAIANQEHITNNRVVHARAFALTMFGTLFLG